MANCLDAMAIGILHEGAIVVGMIVCPKPGGAIIPPAGGERSPVKGVYRRAVGSAETQMRAWDRCSQSSLAGDGKFDAKGTGCRTIIGAAAFAEIDDADQPQRTQCHVVETAATIDVADT